MSNQVKLDPHGIALMQQFRELLPTLEQLGKKAYDLLCDALHEQGIYVTAVEHRVKKEASLAKKLELKGAKYKSIDDVTDLDIFSTTAAPLYLCQVYALKHDDSRKRLIFIYDTLNGKTDSNITQADMMLEQAKTLPFMHSE